MAMSIYDHQLPYDTHNLYTITFFQHTISTIVTNSPFHVDSWIADIQRLHPFRHVGLDVEWRPSFAPNVQNPVATLQLCVGDRCLVFQIFHSPRIPQSLINFLGNPNYTFTGVGIENDVAKLMQDYNIRVYCTADLGKLAADVYGVREYMNAGIKDLTSWILGREMEKPRSITLSGWDNRRLTPPQVQYASLDAFLSFEIGRVLFAAHH
ncbi:hypothetical protein SSX86_010776 [Deinandra increscens subsp. villosa]|uniref:3'-5' exonuclease domain-containing protein n=1 Tax=Deinandra increscens subsp. villosa TaxID=3103831 RepID=A0AAP0DFX2_9ASTR